MNTFLMILDLPGRPPSPADRIRIARKVFERRYGRPPAAVYVNESQLTAGASVAEAGVVPVGCCWIPIEDAPRV